MDNKILGLHHITAIAGNAKRNYDFYTRILGLRLVKKTVNFDDPGTYHFYFGNETGTPGTILTFFPWEGITSGRTGTGMATDIGYSVPSGSLEFWAERFKQFQVNQGIITEIFGEQSLPFQDPDGLNINLVVPKQYDERKPWETPDVNAAVATKGFHHVVLTLKNIKATAEILTDVFGYRLLQQEGSRYRFVTDAVENASIVDLIESAHEIPGLNASGTNHHIAFRVKDEETQMLFREKILDRGLNITSKIDRDYFYSLYFREPGGVLFEIATDNPGFTVDETPDQLGSSLRLPKQYEASRENPKNITQTGLGQPSDNNMHQKKIIYAGKSLHNAKKALIMLHGRGAGAEDILSLSEHLDVGNYALLAPQATNNTWYPYSFMSPPSANEPWLSSALQLLNDMVSDLGNEGINKDNIYFLGFSQGACLTLEFVARNATKYGGIVAFTGGLIGDKIYAGNYSGDFSNTPIFIGTSNPDPHVPVERVYASSNILKNMRADITEKVYDNMGHTINQDEIKLANELIFRSQHF